MGPNHVTLMIDSKTKQINVCIDKHSVIPSLEKKLLKNKEIQQLSKDLGMNIEVMGNASGGNLVEYDWKLDYK